MRQCFLLAERVLTKNMITLQFCRCLFCHVVPGHMINWGNSDMTVKKCQNIYIVCHPFVMSQNRSPGEVPYTLMISRLYVSLLKHMEGP